MSRTLTAANAVRLPRAAARRHVHGALSMHDSALRLADLIGKNPGYLRTAKVIETLRWIRMSQASTTRSILRHAGLTTITDRTPIGDLSPYQRRVLELTLKAPSVWRSPTGGRR